MWAKLIFHTDAMLRDRKGVAALEYGIIAAAILGAIGATVVAIGGDVSTLFNSVKTALDAAGG